MLRSQTGNRTLTTLRLAVLGLAICVALLAAVGCGGSGEKGGDEDGGSGSGEAGATGAPPVDWTLFGRIPARTHYLAAAAHFNPPLRREWSFNTRGLIEFPPAVHDGIAY